MKIDGNAKSQPLNEKGGTQKKFKRIYVALFDIDGCLYWAYKDHTGVEIQRWLLESNQALFAHLIEYVQSNSFDRLVVGLFTKRQDAYIDLLNSRQGGSCFPALPIIQSFLSAQLQCEVVMELFCMSDIYPAFGEGAEGKPAKGKVAGENYKARLRELNLTEQHDASNTQEFPVPGWVVDHSKVSIAFAHAHRAPVLNPDFERIVIDIFDDGDRKDKYLSSVYNFFRKHHDLLPKNGMLRLFRYLDGKKPEQYETDIEGTGIIDENYEWSVRYLSAVACNKLLKNNKLRDEGPEKDSEDVSNADDLINYHKKNCYYLDASRPSEMRVTILRSEEIKKFIKFRQKEIPKLASERTLGNESYATANSLFEEGLIPECFLNPKIQQNLRNLQKIYGLIRQGRSSDSSIIAAMKHHSEIGCSNEGEFKSSKIDDEASVFERMTQTTDYKEGKKIAVKAYREYSQESVFVTYGNKGRVYYPGVSDDLIQLNKLQGDYPIYISLSATTAVNHLKNGSYDEQSGTITIGIIANEEIEEKEEFEKLEKKFVQQCVDYVAQSGKDTDTVIYLVNGEIGTQGDGGLRYNNATIYQRLGWTKKTGVENPEKGKPGIHSYQLTREQVGSTKNLEIVYLPTTSNPDCSINITEKDLMLLYEIAIKVKGSQPLVVHCTEGYDRAPRIIFAIDLFLQFDQIMQKNVEEQIKAIIERYLNLRDSRAPGALPRIKQCEEAFYLAYAFKAIDTYCSALGELQKDCSQRKDFFEKLETYQSTEEKINFVERALNEDGLSKTDKRVFILLDQLLRERRFAERACLWEINPKLYFTNQDGLTQQQISIKKRYDLESTLLKNYAVMLQHRPKTEIPVPSALLATGIVWDGYDLALMPDNMKLETGKFYVRMVENDLEYSFISPNGDQIIKGKIVEEDLKKDFEEKEIAQLNPTDFKPENLKSFLSKILEITSQKGHPLWYTDLEQENILSDREKAENKMPEEKDISGEGKGKEKLNEENESRASPYSKEVTQKEVRQRISKSISQHREIAKKIPDQEKFNESIGKVKNKFKEHLKESIEENHSKLIKMLVCYIYNRIYRQKWKAFITGGLWSPEIFLLKDKDYQEAKRDEIITHALYVYGQKDKAPYREGQRSEHLYNAISCLDELTRNKVIDALYLIGELYNQPDRLLDEALAKIINAYSNPDGPQEINNDQLKRKAMELEASIKASVSTIIQQHGTYNQNLEQTKPSTRFFSCFPRVTKSRFGEILKEGKELLRNESTSTTDTNSNGA